MAHVLDNGLATPLYQQLIEAIQNGVKDGTYSPGTQLPTEEALASQFKVSRATVRRALDELTKADFLTKKQGRGTFVNAPKLTRKISQTAEVLAFADMCAAAGMQAGATVVKTERVSGTQDFREFLGVPSDDDLLLIQRIRTADGIPIMLENTYAPYDEFVFIKGVDLNDGSIFEETERVLGRKPGGHDRCTLGVARADVYSASKLRVPLGEPLFEETVFLVDSEGRPLFVAQDYFVGSLYMFNI